MRLCVFTCVLFTVVVQVSSADVITNEEILDLVNDARNTVLEERAAFVLLDTPNPQVPCVWDALKILKGSKSIRDVYPQLTLIPSTGFNCANVHHAGFYADVQTDCQVIRRCDPSGGLSSYLCPVQTIFNQITLTCDWWYNVDCSLSAQFQNYSNPRLYHPGWVLLDDCESTSTNDPYGATSPTRRRTTPYHVTDYTNRKTYPPRTTTQGTTDTTTDDYTTKSSRKTYPTRTSTQGYTDSPTAEYTQRTYPTRTTLKKYTTKTYPTETTTRSTTPYVTDETTTEEYTTKSGQKTYPTRKTTIDYVDTTSPEYTQETTKPTTQEYSTKTYPTTTDATTTAAYTRRTYPTRTTPKTDATKTYQTRSTRARYTVKTYPTRTTTVGTYPTETTKKPYTKVYLTKSTTAETYPTRDSTRKTTTLEYVTDAPYEDEETTTRKSYRNPVRKTKAPVYEKDEEVYEDKRRKGSGGLVIFEGGIQDSQITINNRRKFEAAQRAAEEQAAVGAQNSNQGLEKV